MWSPPVTVGVLILNTLFLETVMTPEVMLGRIAVAFVAAAVTGWRRLGKIVWGEKIDY
jgi:hypothetical protein